MGGDFSISDSGQVAWGQSPASMGRALINILAVQMDEGLRVQIGEHRYMDGLLNMRTARIGQIMDEDVNHISTADFQSAVMATVPQGQLAPFTQYVRNVLAAAGDIGGRSLDLDQLAERFSDGVTAEQAAADTEVISEPPPPTGLPIITEPPF
jgi:hypothetical protein